MVWSMGVTISEFSTGGNYLFIYYRFVTRSKSYVMAQGLVFIKKKN